VRKSITMEIPGDLSQLAPVASAVDGLLAENAVAPDVAFQVNLCIDELVTNAVRHGAAADGRPLKIGVRVTVGRRRGVEVQVSDDGTAFNPLTAPPPDLDAALDDRPVGGLGLHLVRTFMDEVLYARQGDRNVVTLRKRRAGAAAPAPDATSRI
jgi:anti-sigma regulatory factor (Ser/Thr protein kinase)